MNKHDEFMLVFDRSWAPFGGPSDEDIFVRFGITPAAYRERVSELESRSGKLP